MVLTGVAQLVGASSHKAKVLQFDSGQGMCPGCGFCPPQGAFEKQQIDVSLSH